MYEPRPTVADLGERKLIEVILGHLPAPPSGEIWAGDDTAVVRAPGSSLLFTTDLVVEGFDFRLTYASGADVGWKVVAANASDIAAMGGRPAHAVATLALEPSTPVALVEDIARGLASACERFGVSLVGGDISEASELSLGLALLGAPGRRTLLRSGASPGQAVCVTGQLGGARAGLRVLQEGMEHDRGPAAGVVRRQLRPEARVEAGEVLVDAGASAAIDLSDGLAVDLGHLTEDSGVGCEIDAAAIPIDSDLEALSARLGLDPLETAIGGGEDFELLFTIEEEGVAEIRSRLEPAGIPVARIGVTTGGPARIGERGLAEWRSLGWEHLRNR